MSENSKAQMYKERWEAAKDNVLKEGEYAVPIKDANIAEYYFITNKARIFSVYGKTCREIKQFTSEPKNRRAAGTNKQLHVRLRKPDGGYSNWNVSKLMEKIFSISVFNPTGTDQLHCHHIRAYRPEKGTENNCPENLQTVGADVHQGVFAAIQQAETSRSENEKTIWKKLTEIKTDEAFMITAITDDDGECAVQGAMLSDEQRSRLLYDPKVQQFVEEARVQLCERRLEQAKMLMRDVEEHPEQYRIIDGIPRRESEEV